jgi:hypothetical protein
MAKKKYQSKKHKFKHATSHDGLMSSTSEPEHKGSTTSEIKSSLRESRKSVAVFSSVSRDFGYVAVDLRRVATFAVALVAIELILWYVFGHTGVGPSVYKLVNV